MMVGALVLGGSGCSTAPETEDFDVTLVNLNTVPAGGGGIGEAAVVFTVRLQNATPQAVTLTGAAHKLYLNGVYVGQGLSNERVEVPRLGTTTADLTVHLSTFRLARAFYGVYRSQQADYRIVSTLYGDRSNFRTRKEGSIDLHGLNLPPPPAGAPPAL
jgi:LEA14-like dessication related protein